MVQVGRHHYSPLSQTYICCHENIHRLRSTRRHQYVPQQQPSMGRTNGRTDTDTAVTEWWTTGHQGTQAQTEWDGQRQTRKDKDADRQIDRQTDGQQCSGESGWANVMKWRMYWVTDNASQPTVNPSGAWLDTDLGPHFRKFLGRS